MSDKPNFPENDHFTVGLVVGTLLGISHSLLYQSKKGATIRQRINTIAKHKTGEIWLPESEADFLDSVGKIIATAHDKLEAAMLIESHTTQISSTAKPKKPASKKEPSPPVNFFKRRGKKIK